MFSTRKSDSVSYTHLDVYKRQVRILYIHRLVHHVHVLRNRTDSDLLADWCMGFGTQRDVYKRQTLVLNILQPMVSCASVFLWRVKLFVRLMQTVAISIGVVKITEKELYLNDNGHSDIVIYKRK